MAINNADVSIDRYEALDKEKFLFYLKFNYYF